MVLISLSSPQNISSEHNEKFPRIASDLQPGAAVDNTTMDAVLWCQDAKYVSYDVPVGPADAEFGSPSSTSVGSSSHYGNIACASENSQLFA